MTLVRLLFIALAASLAGLILWAMGADGRGLGAVLSAMAGEPWTVVTLADLYLGFVLSACIIMLSEKRWWIGALWALPVFVLGNVWTVVWFALRLPVLVRRLRSAP